MAFWGEMFNYFSSEFLIEYVSKIIMTMFAASGQLQMPRNFFFQIQSRYLFSMVGGVECQVLGITNACAP